MRYCLPFLLGLCLMTVACDEDDVPNNLNPDLPCEVSPGTLAGGPFTFTTDGLRDSLSGVSVSGGVGPRQSYVLTDGNGSIIRVYSSLTDLGKANIDAVAPGALQLYYVSYQIGLRGLTRGSDIDDLDGCFELSNALAIARPGCRTAGGTLSGAGADFSIDGRPDNITPGNYTISGATGERAAYFLTDPRGKVLGIYPTLDAVAGVDLEDLSGDTVLLRYAAIDGRLRGDTVGSTRQQIQGCLSLSNPVVLRRRCLADGGRLTGGPYVFSIDDDADNIPADSVSLSMATGEVSTYVITDSAGVILALPATLAAVEAYDFNAGGAGRRLIRHLSANGPLAGNTIGARVTRIQGCYDLSNPVVVRRSCNAVGGELEGGPFNFVVDTIPDFVSGITVARNFGDNSTYVVTDAAGVILALPADLAALRAIDFNAGGPGNRRIWQLSFNGPLSGATVGAPVSRLMGCFELSNPLTVTRTTP